VRTTVTLDDDTARMLDQLRRQRSLTFKDAVNESLRAGLAMLLAKPRPRRGRYETKPVAAAPRVTSLDDIAAVLSLAEGDGRS
jgi:hypothetical protein